MKLVLILNLFIIFRKKYLLFMKECFMNQLRKSLILFFFFFQIPFYVGLCCIFRFKRRSQLTEIKLVTCIALALLTRSSMLDFVSTLVYLSIVFISWIFHSSLEFIVSRIWRLSHRRLSLRVFYAKISPEDSP